MSKPPQQGQVVTIDKQSDEHDNLPAIVQSHFMHEPSQRVIYRVLVEKNGRKESRHFNEENLK